MYAENPRLERGPLSFSVEYLKVFMKKVDIHNLLHTQWEYKYHIVFAPQYRRKVFYGQKCYEIGQILRELCKWKGVNMLEGEACPDHIYTYHRR